MIADIIAFIIYVNKSYLGINIMYTIIYYDRSPSYWPHVDFAPGLVLI